MQDRTTRTKVLVQLARHLDVVEVADVDEYVCMALGGQHLRVWQATDEAYLRMVQQAGSGESLQSADDRQPSAR